MCAKFISVGFLPPMEMSLVLQEPALIPFRKKKKLKRKRLFATALIFFLVFSYPEITKTVRVTNNFTCNVRVMDMGFVIQNISDIFNKFFRRRCALYPVILTKIHDGRIDQTNNFIYVGKFTEFFHNFYFVYCFFTSLR